MLNPPPLAYQLLEELLLLAGRRHGDLTPWWLALRPGIRLLQSSSRLLRRIATARGHYPEPKDGLPAEAWVALQDLVDGIDGSLERWLALVTEWRGSPLLCSLCGAPRTDFGEERCERCPPAPESTPEQPPGQD